MKQKNMVLVAVAVVCGLIAAFLTSQMGAKGKAQQIETVMVPVALVDLPVGTKIKADEIDKAVVLKAMPKDAVPQLYVEQSDALKDKFVTRTIRAGEPFNPNDVTTSGFLNPPENHSVMSVSMSTVEAASGFIGPGARVDILASVVHRKTQKATVFPLFLDMLVLAVNSDSTRSQTPGGATPNVGMVSLAVTAEQQLILQGAISRGAMMRMALRHADKPAQHRQMTSQEIWNILADKTDEEPIAPSTPPTAPTVEMVKVKVPTVDLTAGTPITEELIAKSFKDAEYPVALVPESAVKELKSYAANGDYLLKDLPANYFLPKSFLGAKPKEPVEPKMAKVGPSDSGSTPKEAEPAETPKPVPPKPVYVEVTIQTAKGVVRHRYQKLSNGDHKYVGVVLPDADDEVESKPDAKPSEKKPAEAEPAKGTITAG